MNRKFKILMLIGIIFIGGLVSYKIFFQSKNFATEKFNVNQPTNYTKPLIIASLGNILSITPVDAKAVEAQKINEETIKYLDAYANTDVEQIKYPNKLKESLILKSANHPDSFEYKIDRQNFDWTFDGEGNIIISSKQKIGQALPSSEGGEISAKRMQQYAHEQAKIFKIPKPFMIQETRDKKQDTNNIDTGKVKADIIGDKLILTPDKEWLKNHQYPIVVDPTVEKMPSMIKELAENRSYNSLTFLNDDGSYTTMTHVGQINYKDESGKFQPVNTTLISTDKGWQQEKASYKSIFPEYADEWLQFENMYEQGGTFLKMKPVARHVVGKLVTDKNDLWHGKKVVYRDAFGEGNDLELIAGNVALFKFIKLNQKPTDLSQDVEFNFELELKPEEKLIINNQEWNGVEEVITSEQIGITIPNGNTSYLRKFTVWDNKKSQSIKIKISNQNGKIYFTKILPKEFLETAEYPVYTDASTSPYVGAGDGEVYQNNGTTWDASHNDTSGSVAAATGAYGFDPETYWDSTVPEVSVGRSFYPINTATLDDGAVISAASLFLYAREHKHEDNDANAYINIVQTTQDSNTTLSTSDFNNCGSVHSPTTGATNITISTISITAYTEFILNATGRGWISTTDYTKLGAREGHDLADDPISVDGATNRAAFYYSEQAGTDNDPYLSITYNVNPTATTVTDTPDPSNPGRSVSFIYDWNDDTGDSIKIKICKTNSLTNQNCDDGYWATSTDFTTSDPITVVYDVVAGDAGQTRNYWAFACDDGGLCTTGTAGSFSVNAISTVPNIKVRGGLQVR